MAAPDELAQADKLLERTLDQTERFAAAFNDVRRHLAPGEGADESGRRRDLVRAMGTLLDCLRKFAPESAKDAAAITAKQLPHNNSLRRERQQVLAGLAQMAYSAGTSDPLGGREELKERLERMIALRHRVTHAEQHLVSNEDADFVAGLVEELAAAFSQISEAYGALFVRRAGECLREAWESGTSVQRHYLFVTWATAYAHQLGTSSLDFGEARVRIAAEHFLSGMLGNEVRIEVVDPPRRPWWKHLFPAPRHTNRCTGRQ
jgi:hypothetical protein